MVDTFKCPEEDAMQNLQLEGLQETDSTESTKILNEDHVEVTSCIPLRFRVINIRRRSTNKWLNSMRWVHSHKIEEVV